jgi:hypothetical protein
LQHWAEGQICSREIRKSRVQGCVLHRWTLHEFTLIYQEKMKGVLFTVSFNAIIGASGFKS